MFSNFKFQLCLNILGFLEFLVSFFSSICNRFLLFTSFWDQDIQQNFYDYNFSANRLPIYMTTLR
jgi:hypothetical protein